MRGVRYKGMTYADDESVLSTRSVGEDTHCHASDAVHGVVYG